MLDSLVELTADQPTSRASALTWRGFVLDDLERHDEAIASYDEAIATASDVVMTADALVRKAAALARLGHVDDAVRALADAIVRLRGEAGLEARVELTRAYVERGRYLARLHRMSEARASFGRALAECAEADEPELRRFAPSAALEYARASVRVGRPLAAVNAAGALVARRLRRPPGA